jgi:hypothetical protein
MATKRLKARIAKGIMKSQQMLMVFADCPQGDQSQETLFLRREQSPRLHKASAKEFKDLLAARAVSKIQ